MSTSDGIVAGPGQVLLEVDSLVWGHGGLRFGGPWSAVLEPGQVIAVLGPNAWSAAIAIAIVYTPIFARLLRGPALVIVESEYVLGARAIGAGDARIVLTHVLPNLISVILVQASILLSAAILVEASLSFLGLGAQPPTPSLGLMLSEGRNFLMLSPWPAVFAGLAILLLSFGFNLLGDALRDTLDPRLRGAE